MPSNTDMRATGSPEPAPPRIGSAAFSALLMERGQLNAGDLARAEQHARREQMDLAEALVTLNLVPEIPCYSILAEAAGVPLVDLTTTTLSDLAVRLVPERLARRHRAVPLKVDNRTLTFATCWPFDPEVEDDLSFASGRRAVQAIAPRALLFETLDRCYPKPRELDVLANKLSGEQPTVAMFEKDAVDSAGSTVIDLCNRIVIRAVEVGASDVHIDCGADSTIVRYRICGVLEPVLTVPGAVSQLIRNRFKVMARANIAVHKRPQDGAFQLRVKGRSIDVRLSTLPTIGGEKIVLRVIDSVSPLQALDRLGYDEETLARLRHSLTRPDGLVLVTGPTGSGKTTALYAALGHLRTGRTNIVSVEDPVERRVPGVTQIPVNAQAGTTFATALRSLMRQDPNVIMVGEIRDEEVAQIVGQAACTGHLVVSSMHTSDSATAVTRLSNLGLEPYKIAESLCAVVAQRLVRTLCPGCKRSQGAGQALRSGERQPRPASVGPGCADCNHTGYSGRVPVAELLTPDEALRDAITRGATAREIRAAMRASGVPTMRDHALRLVAEGVTSMDEVNRVLGHEDARMPGASRLLPRVLVTDDDAITRMLVKVLLEREQFEVLEATNGAEAMQIVRTARPDLLLIDLNMPEMNGYEVIENIRRQPNMPALPILVLTADDGPGIEQRVLELGADDYLLKPFEPSVLLSRVNAVFRRQQANAA